jgi:integrase
MLADGGNLYLQVSLGKDDNVRKSWVFRYEFRGARREMGLGPLHTIGLSEARTKARTLRQELLDDIDPLVARRERRAAQRLEEAKTMTFSQCVEAYLAAHEGSWKSARHAAQWRMTLTKYCRDISDLPVKDIDTDLVMRVLTPLWSTKTETARRLRGRVERVLAWAKGRGLRDGENPARWSGHLDEMLAAPSKIAVKKHHPSMHYSDVPTFMRELRACDGVTARALEWTILTAVRTGETVGALWSEIEGDATWVIPPSRTKADSEHRVPLSPRCVEILTMLPHEDERVFAGLGEFAMRRALRVLRSDAVVHGFRATFRTWAAEQTGFPHEVCEAALGHRVSNEVVRAYRRTSFFEKRRDLMEAWAKFCEPTEDNVVVPMARPGRG